MNKFLFFIIIIALIVGVSFFYFGNNYLTGSIIEPDYFTYTRAICNESNFCQDYIIECEGDVLISMNPISGAVIQHSKDWEDPRENTSQENFCKRNY